MLSYRFVLHYGASGSGTDTVYFVASHGGSSCGLPSDFDEVALKITLGPIDTLYVGHSICIDSTESNPFGRWGVKIGVCDVIYGTAGLDWDGPHCFTIVNPPCAVAVTGDINTTGSISSSDIIAMVHVVFYNHIHRSEPCLAASDVNCDGNVTAADIIYLVNTVFKGGPPPCNVCALIWTGVWGCE
jgi:hypothetical protein